MPKPDTAASFDTFTINPQTAGAFVLFVHHFKSMLNSLVLRSPPLVVLCIGSDRSTGDALGPLVGSMLSTMYLNNNMVYGTLEKPVHALNLEITNQEIAKNHKNTAVLAIDSSLGAKNNIGSIQLGMGSLQPGAGVNKKLPAVGDIFITGIVNMGGFMEFMVLQSTRLGIVFPMARFISRGIARALSINNIAID